MQWRKQGEQCRAWGGLHVRYAGQGRPHEEEDIWVRIWRRWGICRYMGRHHFRQRNQQCKGPEVGAFLTCSRTSKRWCNWSGVSEGESTRERGREVTGLGLEGHQHLFNKMGGHCKVKSRGMTRFNLNCKMIDHRGTRVWGRLAFGGQLEQQGGPLSQGWNPSPLVHLLASRVPLGSGAPFLLAHSTTAPH